MINRNKCNRNDFIKSQCSVFNVQDSMINFQKNNKHLLRNNNKTVHHEKKRTSSKHRILYGKGWQEQQNFKTGSG